MWTAALQYSTVEYLPLTFTSTSASAVPALDEGLFQRLLEAAYVVQQHNDTLRARETRLETSQVLAQIAEIPPDNVGKPVGGRWLITQPAGF